MQETITNDIILYKMVQVTKPMTNYVWTSILKYVDL